MNTNRSPQEMLDIVRRAIDVLDEMPEPGVAPGYLGGFEHECVLYADTYLREAERHLAEVMAGERTA